MVIHHLCHCCCHTASNAMFSIVNRALKIVRFTLSPIAIYQRVYSCPGRVSSLQGHPRALECANLFCIAIQPVFQVLWHVAHINRSFVGIPQYRLCAIVTTDNDEAIISYCIEHIESLLTGSGILSSTTFHHQPGLLEYLILHELTGFLKSLFLSYRTSKKTYTDET